MRHVHPEIKIRVTNDRKRNMMKLFFKWILRKSIIATSCLRTFVYFWWLSEWEHVHHNTQIQYSIRQLNWRIVLSWTLNHYEYPLMPSENVTTVQRAMSNGLQTIAKRFSAFLTVIYFLDAATLSSGKYASLHGRLSQSKRDPPSPCHLRCVSDVSKVGR